MTKVEPIGGQSGTTVKLTILVKISLVLASLGFLLVVISSGFDGWLTYTVVIAKLGYRNEMRFGIFYACTEKEGCKQGDDSTNQWQYDAAYIYGTAIITTVVTMVAIVIHCLKHQASWAIYLKYISAWGAFVSWLLVFASDFLMVANRDNLNPLLPKFDIDFALVLSICGGILYFIVTIILAVDIFFFTA